MSFGESLRTLATDSHALVGFVIAAGLVLVLTPLVGRLAPLIGGLDDKADRPRVHKGAIPRIGGLAIVAGILIPTAILIDLDGPYLGIFIGTLAVAALGLFDDLHGVTPSRKLLGVTLIALIPVAGFGVTFDRVTLPGIGDFDMGWVAYPLTVLWIALLANLVNLIDGMDSLAAGIVAIAAASFAILSASFGRADAAVLSAIVCGATLAFLFHNYHPAKIFMGDSGALALGFLLATLSVDGVL
jgi:UDP-GlcNAc:undecaprenyl-phosphate GlcNAc-1-phosphate transferase